MAPSLCPMEVPALPHSTRSPQGGPCPHQPRTHPWCRPGPGEGRWVPWGCGIVLWGWDNALIALLRWLCMSVWHPWVQRGGMGHPAADAARPPQAPRCCCCCCSLVALCCSAPASWCWLSCAAGRGGSHPDPQNTAASWVPRGAVLGPPHPHLALLLGRKPAAELSCGIMKGKAVPPALPWGQGSCCM